MSSIFDLEQTSYWLLLVWLFGGGMIAHMLPKKQMLINGRSRECWYFFSAMLLVLPYILWAGYRTGGDDTLPYRIGFMNNNKQISDIPALIAGNEKDVGYDILIILVKNAGISNYQHFFLLIAAFQMLCIVHTFRKYSASFWISIFLFIASTDYMSWMHNCTRQFIAVSMTFAAFGLLVRRKYVRFILVTLLASTFHGSALFMLPLAYIMQGPALNRKTMLTIAAAALCFPFIDEFTPILETLMADSQYGDVMSNAIWSSDDGTSIIRVLVYSAPALVIFFGRRYIIRSVDPAINQCINASILTMAVYLVSAVTSGIYVGRLPIYTTLHGYMVLPWAIDQIFEKTSAQFIKAIMVVLYLGFFYFQMGISWGLL